MRAEHPPIGRLLGAVHLAILLVPAGAFVGLRLVDLELVEAAERRLVAEAVVVAEAWRAEWLRAEGRPVDAAPEAPPWAEDERYWPVEPLIDPRALAADEPPRSGTVAAADRLGSPWRAGAALTPMLRRAQRHNLAGVRVLDGRGCVVASSGSQLGDCLAAHPEVDAALRGAYAAVGRERISDEPLPGLSSLRRRGKVRLFVALPVFDGGQVIGVVRASRTARDPLEVAWQHRGALLLALLICGGGTWAISRFLARTIAGPVRAITDEARRIASGPEGATMNPPAGRVPAEVAELAEALSTMTARLAGHASDVADFAAALSHELKTPLTSIRGAAELLRDSWTTMSPEQRARFLAHVDDDAERMQRLVTRLLVLARIGAEDSPPEPVDIAAELRSLASRHDGIELDLEHAPSSYDIAPDRLAMAVGNLLDNAFEHGEPPVRLGVVASGGTLVIDVQDHGPGISDGNLGRVFDRFFTTQRDAGGTGLGLAIVRAVARAEGGDVTVETGPEGTTFRLRL